MSIEEVERVSITVLMDNSTDLLLKNSDHATRAPLITNGKFLLPPPIAEHGFSALVNVVRYDENNKTKNKAVEIIIAVRGMSAVSGSTSITFFL